MKLISGETKEKVQKYVLLATVKDRLPMMSTCMSSIRKYLSDWTPVVVAQEYSDKDASYVKSQLPNGVVIVLDKRCGPHNAKLVGLRYIHGQGEDNFIVCSIDDDMEFIEQTNLQPCVDKVQEQETGFVSAGWVKHENHLGRWDLVSEFIKQPIVYTGGGMVFDRKTAEIVLRIPDGDYFCDNSEWSLAVYLQGFTNYRYRGSLTIHRICRTGGRKGWVGLGKKKVPDQRYLQIKQGKQTNSMNNFLVGSSSDLTEEAHSIHKENERKVVRNGRL